MSKYFTILLMGLVVFSDYCWSQEMGGSKVVICLYDLDTPPGADITYIVKAVRDTITNRLSKFPNVVIYPGESQPAKYFEDPDAILKADKVQLLQIRRESGFDGLIFGKLERNESGFLLTLHLVDFSSGRIYFSGEFQGNFGSALLSWVEEKIASYMDSLTHYYNCVLDITSEPSGAEVWVNGEKAGVTPVNNLEVKDGQTQIQIKKQGYIPYETNIGLQAGQKGLVYALLSKYSLTATSQPSEANVSLNGRVVGITPIKDMNLDQREFTIEFTKKGFAPYSEFISLKPGEQAYIHAELYDLLTDHLRRKKSPWKIDSHNLSFIQTLDVQDLKEIEVEVFPVSNFRYYAKFGRFSTGLGMGIGVLNASQHFDTFLGTGEGYEPFTIEIVKGTVFGQYNILEKMNWLELYLGAFTGFSLAMSTRPDAPSDLKDLQKVSPIAGGEIGASLYLVQMLKLSVMAGSYYVGKLEYAIKEASYWGKAKYRRGTSELYPFYIGFAITLSIWPSLM